MTQFCRILQEWGWFRIGTKRIYQQS